MIAKLETLFRDWPFQGEKSPAIPTNTEFAKPGAYLSQKDVNQGRVSILLPGIKRDDPDYFPGLLMNHILGGGGFTSRIMSRVRSDEGLAYSAGSSFPGGTYYPLAFSAYFQSKSRTVAYAASIVLEEMKKMTAEPATEAELNTAKRAFIDTFPDIFSTKSQIANTFAQEEFTGRYARNPEFFKNYRARFQSVTVADVQRVARKFLHPDQAVILAVGQKDEILKGSADHPVALPALVGGHVTELPQRDPLTLKPVTK
jgi:predicted Zn-dependent peptidase